MFTNNLVTYDHLNEFQHQITKNPKHNHIVHMYEAQTTGVYNKEIQDIHIVAIKVQPIPALSIHMHICTFTLAGFCFPYCWFRLPASF